MTYLPISDVLAKNVSDFPILTSIMSVSRWMMIVLIILCKNETTKRNSDKFYIVACSICLCVYYAFWISYYIGIVLPIIFLGMAISPCVYFFLFILWQRKYIVMLPAIVFSVLHIGITYSDFVIG